MVSTHHLVPVVRTRHGYQQSDQPGKRPIAPSYSHPLAPNLTANSSHEHNFPCFSCQLLKQTGGRAQPLRPHPGPGRSDQKGKYTDHNIHCEFKIVLLKKEIFINFMLLVLSHLSLNGQIVKFNLVKIPEMFYAARPRL